MAAAFHDVTFPLSVGFGAKGGPERKTEIVTLASGREERNAVWAHARRRYDAGLGVRSRADLAAIIAFFEARRGRLHGFRFRDPLDDASSHTGVVTPTDQQLGMGNGSQATFTLIKAYGAGPSPYQRWIRKPVPGTIRVAVAGVEKAEGTAFAVDTANGFITFLAGHVPTGDQLVTAGFRFDVPVRFDTDRLEIDLTAFAAGSLPSIPLIELIP
jgi:uncharacterized protein (TIGR02217 family)